MLRSENDRDNNRDQDLMMEITGIKKIVENGGCMETSEKRLEKKREKRLEAKQKKQKK